MKTFMWIFWITLILLIVATATLAKAHNAPSGWRYPIECCSNTDCFPITIDDIKPIQGGYVIMKTGQFVPFDKVQASPDDQFHMCVHGGEHWDDCTSSDPSCDRVQAYEGKIIGSPGVPHWCSSKATYTANCPGDERNLENPLRELWCIWVPVGI